MADTAQENPANSLRTRLVALNDDTSDKGKAARVATSRMFQSMSELFDTALVRTPGMIGQLWNKRDRLNAEKCERTLYDHVKAGSQMEDLLVLNDTLVSCAKSLQPINQPFFDGLVAAFRQCGQQQVPETKVQDKSQMLYNQLMRDPSVLNACFCSSDTEAKALFSADNGYVARAVAKLKNAQNIPMDTIQELIASGARRRGVFAVGGVNGFKNEQLDATVNFLEPLEYLHSNMSNLVAHVWHSMKDDMATMPDEEGVGSEFASPVQQRTELKLEIFEKLWPFRRHRLSAAGGRETSSKDRNLDATAEATSQVVRKYHQQLLLAQPDLASTALSSQELAAKVKSHLKDLLVKFQNAITPGSPSLNCATHIVAVHAGVFVAVVQLRSAGSSEPLSVEVQPHDIRTPAKIWTGSQPRSPGSGVIWERFSSLAMRALCYYLDRAKLSGERHPGARAIFDLMMWLATYCGEAATKSQLSGAASPDIKLEADVAGHQASKSDKSRKDSRPTHGLHSNTSAMSAKPFSRDPETNAMLPAVWRPYRLPSAVVSRSLVNCVPVPCTVPSPMHFPEVEPEQQ